MPGSVMILGLGFIFFCIWSLIRARTTVYDFRDGFLYVTRGGILFRSEQSYKLTQLLDTNISRGPLDRLTNNGTLKLHFDKQKMKVSLRGLAPMPELKQIRDDLNEFAQLVRTYPALKGLVT